eukprot:Gregarina_sp_Poly_1__3053@NODE_1859_length_3191_cov_124_216709_g1204_i0_p1_GENE_NODE_1859_length_3191_cov_124_216709_g1204_i0NODE_1859_length_3191_cov_124_216709_g1204_i0_p1_ORF_typecomplete_len518_score82_83_NODE_1859_length_3191_cov_124_216709_g1204_i015993152
MLYLIKHALEQSSAAPLAEVPTPVGTQPPPILPNEKEDSPFEQYSFADLKQEVEKTVKQKVTSVYQSGADAGSLSFEDSLLLAASRELSFAESPSHPVSDRVKRSGDHLAKIKEALEKRKEVAAHYSKMQAAAAEVQDTLRSSTARLASRYAKAVKKNTAGARELLSSAVQDFSAGSAGVSLAIFSFMYVNVVPAEGWPSNKADNLSSYRKAVLRAGTFLASPVVPPFKPSLNTPPFPSCDFLPSLKQDWKDLSRDAIQMADSAIKGSDFASYQDFINQLLLVEATSVAITSAVLRRRLVRILLIVHFLNRTFSGALIYYIIDSVFSARATMEPADLSSQLPLEVSNQLPSDPMSWGVSASGSMNTSKGRKKKKVDTHIIPKSLDAMPIEMYIIDAGISSEGQEALSIRGSSSLVFGLKVNDNLVATMTARVSVNVVEFASFGDDGLIDEIGDVIGVRRPTIEEGRMPITRERLDTMWPTVGETPPPISDVKASSLPLCELTNVLRVLISTQPLIVE